MEEVWRSLFGLERRPVTSLNGSSIKCFRKRAVDFVKECKITRHSIQHSVFYTFFILLFFQNPYLKRNTRLKKRQSGSCQFRRKSGNAF
jgi:hypothetical protein